MWRMENANYLFAPTLPGTCDFYVSLHVKEATPREKQEACGETFSENSPSFTLGGEEVRFSILWEWALRHSRRGCHDNILQPPKMGGKRCANPYCKSISWSRRLRPVVSRPRPVHPQLTAGSPRTYGWMPLDLETKPKHDYYCKPRSLRLS